MRNKRNCSKNSNPMYENFGKFVQNHLEKALNLIPKFNLDENDLKNIGIKFKNENKIINQSSIDKNELLAKRPFPNFNLKNETRTNTRNLRILPKSKMDQSKREKGGVSNQKM